jgi:hypothetical protein
MSRRYGSSTPGKLALLTITLEPVLDLTATLLTEKPNTNIKQGASEKSQGPGFFLSSFRGPLLVSACLMTSDEEKDVGGRSSRRDSSHVDVTTQTHCSS